MSTLEEVRSAALSLPLNQRVQLVDSLQESMGPLISDGQSPFESAAAFEAEMDRRLDSYLSGDEPGFRWEDVQKEAHAILREP